MKRGAFRAAHRTAGASNAEFQFGAGLTIVSCDCGLPIASGCSGVPFGTVNQAA